MRRAACIGLALVLLSHAGAAAQELNYQTYLIGTRAMGMGGAFTGVADDPSAAFHNPAGLGLILRSSTSANLSVIAIEGWTFSDGYGSALGPEDLEHDAIPSLPLFVGFVQKFGDRGSDGVREHGIALSVVRPGRIHRRFRVEVSDVALGVADSIRIDHQDDDQWYGVSYGVRLDPSFAVGIGAWLSLRDIVHTEEQFVARGIIPAGARRTADSLFSRQTEASMSAIQLVFRVGAIWQLDPQWRFGVMLQSAPIPISTSATLRSRLGRTTSEMPPSVEELSFVDLEGLPADAPTPWQLRLGASHAFTDSFALAADLALYSPIGSANDPVQTFGPPTEDPLTGDVPSPGTFIPREWYANVTANLSIGVDALIADVVPIQAGVFTDLSAAPSIDGPSAVYRPPQVHGVGASLAGGFHRGDFDVQLGVAGVIGWGTGLGTNPDPSAPPEEAYVPVDVRRHAVYFFLSGTERAAAGLVRELLGDLDGEQPAAGESSGEEAEPGRGEARAGGEARSEEPPAEGPPADEAPEEDERRAEAGPQYLRSPWPDLATGAPDRGRPDRPPTSGEGASRP